MERKRMKFWASVEGVVTEVEGQSCGPDNPDVWWCPSIGASLSEGFHLFGSRIEATAKAREWIAAMRRHLLELEAEL